MSRFSIILFPVLMVLNSCHDISDSVPIIGVKIYDHDGSLSELFKMWDELGINLVLASPTLAAKEDFMLQARDHGIRIFLIIPTFYNTEALDRDPNLYAITSEGQPAAEEWVRFICPNRMDYCRTHLDYLRKITRDLQPDGISLDFIRYFVYWEMVFPDQVYEDLPQTCFDEVCVNKFERLTGIQVPDSCQNVTDRAGYVLSRHLDEWTNFKCLTISDFVGEMVRAIRDVKPGIQINFHAVPWKSHDYQGAVRSIAGQDLAMIAPHVDYISPMCYAHMVKQPPEWVNEVVLDMAERGSPATMLPSIQVERAYLDTPLEPEAFRSSLIEALRPPSAGVILWSWEALADSPDKLKIFSHFTAGLRR